MSFIVMRVQTAGILGMVGIHGATALSQDLFEDLETLETTTVVGSKEDIFELPGSAFFLEAEEFRSQNYTNVNRILARVPGVYVREEDGYGNFPNISIRGADGTRAEKTTLMEDGILTAPATYSAPGAYYSPRAARMSAIEILKGSSQIKYGPHTTGGVINYRSTPVPEEQKFYSRLTYGTDNTYLAHLYYGDTLETKRGRFGFLAELFANGSDGFRYIAPGADYAGSGDTGFSVIEPMVKLFWESTSGIPQRVEFKYGYTDFNADETYTGLTEDDVRSSPDRRYAATRFDNIATNHHRTYLKYLVQPRDDLSLEVAGYYNQFDRSWYKLHDLRDNGSVHAGMLTPEGQALLAGTGPGSYRVRDNARDYKLYGLQFQGDWTVGSGEVGHLVSFGTRLHYDEARRKQRNDTITQGDSGAVIDIERGEDGSGGNRRQESRALALWVQDKISWGKFSVTPGVRYEYVDGHYTDYAPDSTDTETGSGDGTVGVWAPGISFTYNPTDLDQIFAGVHKGISIPGPRSFIRSGVDPEESIGYELGYRTRRNGVGAELIGFYTDFDNLIGTDTGLGESSSTNAGEAKVLGLEGFLSYDPLAQTKAGTGLPMYFSATWTPVAELDNALSAGGSDNIYAGGEAGARIPYVPDWKLAGGIGWTTEFGGLNLDATYVTDMFGTAKNLDAPVASAREGKTDSLFLVDFSGNYIVNEKVKLLAGIANIFDERGIVSRLPHGPRTNQGRSFWVGAEVTF